MFNCLGVINITEKFEKLKDSKKKQIIKAALLEFAEYGYDLASTNRIVKSAGIGKGMLFYYFNSKEDLYYFLIDYCIETVKKDYLAKIDETVTDLIERINHISKLKIQYINANPEVNQFMATFLLIDKTNLPPSLEQKYQELFTLGSKKLYEVRINEEVLRKDIDSSKIKKFVEWIIKGYQNEILERFKGKHFNEMDLDPLWSEFDEYLEVLNKIFYKQEE